MESRSTFSAARGTATIFGILAGLGGLTHGIGEVLQGNVKPDGFLINSWTQGPIASNMGGEPGMTLVPNLLVTGILTILVSLAVVVWAAFVRDRNSGRILLLLSVAMLLVGGGFGPPIIGMLAGVAGTGIGVPSTWWHRPGPAKVRRIAARLWPWLFGIAIINGMFLVIGSVILVYFFDLNNPDLFTNSFFFSVISLSLTVWLGRAYDLQEVQQPDWKANAMSKRQLAPGP
ncbi:MAG: hypothetical protein M8467_05725 [Anaerolineae bacterium]|nr:hypothetical protein [Anaerolineae bacterium]